MSLSSFFTTPQFEIAMGGAPNVVRLAKATNASDSVYATFVAEVKSNVDGDVYAVVRITFNISDANLQVAPFLKQKALALACYWAHFSGTGGQEVPVEVSKARDLALEQLRRLAAGDLTLGIEQDVSTSAGLAQVDPNPDGTRMTRASLNNAGFA